MSGEHTSPPLFSVIIPTHDRLELLKRAVQSIRQQSFSDYEIIVVDDGSRDGTCDWLAESHGWLRGIRQSNKGPGGARNAGAKVARGQYVAFLDSDDLWFPWTLEVFASSINRYNPSIIAGRYVEFVDEADLKRIEEGRHTTRVFEDVLASSHQALAVGSGTCAIRRDLFETVAFLEDRLNSEDHDLILQMGTQPRFVQIISPATVAWRRHNTSETANLGGSILGAARLVTREKANAYPGGKLRARQRREIVTRHVRPVALECLLRGRQGEAWKLYVATFAWNLSLGRLRYLFGFPLCGAIAFVQHRVFGLMGARGHVRNV